MAWSILYAPEVISGDIPRLPKTNKEQIRRAIEERFTLDPIGLGKPLRYTLKGYRRLKVGNYRIVYQIENASVRILKIGNHKDIYE